MRGEEESNEEDRSLVQKTEVLKTEDIGSPEVQKSGSPVITISRRRSVGILADETASVVAGLVPATSRLKAFAIAMVSQCDSYGMTVR